MENKEGRTRMRGYIRINDVESWELIDKISEDTRYK